MFFAVTAAAARCVHLAVFRGQGVPMVGASASISGFMAAAIRFAFQRGGPLRLSARPGRGLSGSGVAARRGAARRACMIFLAVWFGLNLLFGLGSLGLDGGEQAIAWQAHIGGFLAGLLAFHAVRSGQAPRRRRDDGTGGATDRDEAPRRSLDCTRSASARSIDCCARRLVVARFAPTFSNGAKQRISLTAVRSAPRADASRGDERLALPCRALPTGRSP